jgi:hypothetical protein
MTSYFQHFERKGRKLPKKTEHGTEIVEIDGILVTEEASPTAAPDHMPGATWSGNDRHGWACPCGGCRTDRGEE